MENVNMENEKTESPQTEENTVFSLSKIVKEWFVRFKELANIFGNTDYKGTIERVEGGVDFRGTNVWILIFAFVVASVGLNVNSSAVIIGAMLISPLMGPIIGMGLAVGINDNLMLRRSLMNLFIMMVVSLLASSIYFALSPLNEAQSELLARTTPTIYDVFIAFFGGLAGITALSRKEQMFTVISGVAIATALMPPLCTAGYGLGTLQLRFFWGALYLFFINAFFIALATFLMIRLLKFPKKAYLDAKKEKRVQMYISFFSFLVIVPSVYMAFGMVKESSFNADASNYIRYVKESFSLRNSYIVDAGTEYDRGQSTIILTVMGDTLSPSQKQELEEKMTDFDLKNTRLIIKQISNENGDVSVYQKVIAGSENRLLQAEEKLQAYESEVERYRKQNFPIDQLARECKLHFPYVDTLAVANVVYGSPDKSTLDTVPTAFLSLKKNTVPEDKKKVEEWLKLRLSLKKLKVYIN
ncbi:MAG: DUF389 domain-containing protein [Paludibacteraceae bacterium]|nr:DUF389 domain-containing protein [Paludibacteraceae bacterium]